MANEPFFLTGADEARDVSSRLEEAFCIPPTIDALQISMLKTQLHTNTVPNIITNCLVFQLAKYNYDYAYLKTDYILNFMLAEIHGTMEDLTCKMVDYHST